MKIRKIAIFATAIIVTAIHSSLYALPGQNIKNVGKNALTQIPEETRQYFYAPPKDMKWFEDAKFAVFVHWGVSCLTKVEISWGRQAFRPGFEGGMAHPTTGTPKEVYDNLYKKFNPVNFNADEWIKMVKDSGAKYFIFTTKHHDGFCMFDAKNTDYKITNTPFKRDICKELADACHKYGIKLFWYYSKPDWHHPDYLTENHDNYRKYAWDQIRQLLTDYGKVDGIWFDCLNTTWQHWNTPEMIKMIRTLQPGILINSRWGWGMPGVKDNGDFDNPEQKLGSFKIDRPWETCITMGKGWAWYGGGELTSASECIRMLIQCVGAGGNIALNCGPRPDGKIDPPEIKNYLAIGKWLKENGEAIYGTKGGPYKPGLYGVSCRKKNKIYIHILASLPEESTTIYLPELPVKIEKAYSLDLTPVPTAVKNGKISLDISKIKRNNIDNIVVLELKGSASELKTIETNKKARKVALKDAKASSYYNSLSPDALIEEKKGKFEAGINRSKEWVAQGWKGKHQWVIIEFDKTLINGLEIAEPHGRYLTKKYLIEYEKEGKWLPLSSGEKIGQLSALIFKPVETSKLRLTFIDIAKGDPGLRMFKVYKKEQ